MKNNQAAQKEQYFAQYYKQEVQTFLGDNEVWPCDPKKIEPEWYLLLKSLSEISVKDAIKACKILHSTSFMNPKVSWVAEFDSEYGYITVSAKGSYHSFDICLSSGTISMYDGDNPTSSPLDHYAALDFLRSRGYALPWMDKSVEQLIELGWLRLADVSTQDIG